LHELQLPRFTDEYIVSAWQIMGRYVAHDLLSMRRLDAAKELLYRTEQGWNDWQYRMGIANAGLAPDVVQAIRWMHGTPQFLPVSGLQIVPVTDEQRVELERFLDEQRKWRAEQWWYFLPAEVHEPYTPDFDTLG
jgi:hypothetical protein